MTDVKVKRSMKRSNVSRNVYLASPILFALSFILILFSDNMTEVSISMLGIPLFFAGLFGAITLVIALLLFKDRPKANIFASIFIFLFFSYSDLLTFPVKLDLLKNSEKLENSFPLLGVIVVLVLVLCWKLKRSKRYLTGISKFIFIIAIFSLVFPFYNIVEFEKDRQRDPLAKSPSSLPVANLTYEKRSVLPDIYYIVPDSYSSDKVMNHDFKFDNGPFTTYLRNKGFVVNEDATSNYPKTFLSLGSTLNMEYLDYLSVNKASKDLSIVDPLIKNNNVANFLKSNGYRYYQLGSWWPATKYNQYADENINLYRSNSLGLDEFEYVILESTVLKPILSQFLPREDIGGTEADYRRQMLFQFEQLVEVAKQPGPKFVFAHIIGPHDPFVFNADCTAAKKAAKAKLTTEENYANQVRCINRKLEITIDGILKNSARPPVIILQTDEGAPFLRSRVKPTDNWKIASPLLIGQKFPILQAYYLPGIDNLQIDSANSNVNAFRIVFNNYFGTRLPLLPTKNYILPDVKHLYDFREVTGIVTEELKKKQI